MGRGRPAITKVAVATSGEGPLVPKNLHRLPLRRQACSRPVLATPRRPTFSRNSAPVTCRASPAPAGFCPTSPTPSPLVRCPEAVTVGMGSPVGPLA